MKTDVLGVQINTGSKAEILRDLRGRLARGQQTFIVTPYSESIVTAQTDAEYRQILNSADFALPDGSGIVWAANFLQSPGGSNARGWRRLLALKLSLLKFVLQPGRADHRPIAEQISGSRFIWDLTSLAAENNYKIFLLGGFGDTAAKTATALRKNFPNLKIVGTYEGYPGEQGIVERVNATGTDFLFCAFGPVRQEKWLWANREKLRCRLLIGLGGTFDYLAGNRPPAPKFWANRGLEWLWRLLTQPWRLGRIFRGVLGLVYYCLMFKPRQL